jgi:NAD(P)-dependent dehydrogenase (short-subunit alcohol dehydrogenase family)
MYYLADELGPDRIRVNMVVPSWMWGPPVQAFVKFEAKNFRLNSTFLMKKNLKLLCPLRSQR